MNIEPKTFTTTAAHDVCRYAVNSDDLTVYARFEGGEFVIQDTCHSVVPLRTKDYTRAVEMTHDLFEAMVHERRHHARRRTAAATK